MSTANRVSYLACSPEAQDRALATNFGDLQHRLVELDGAAPQIEACAKRASGEVAKDTTIQLEVPRLQRAASSPGYQKGARDAHLPNATAAHLLQMPAPQSLRISPHSGRVLVLGADEVRVPVRQARVTVAPWH